ncbi:MAG TPA: helix-turn-helix transcriptional regulator [Treponemataceae bacterium]|nr:helix-turn-helix transcriptional regulator [Treponemataceae bacterium]HQL03592.1 helix-turn-helix transcriptional regulator [Treponemataceae bacterium]
MESFGDTLRQTRERQGFDIDKVARDTSISREYIEALEFENTEAFPGEPYLVGFLRNYSDYLGIDAEHMIQLYRAKKIQEAPIPAGLLRDDKPKYLVPVIAGSVLLLLITGGILLYYFLVFSKADEGKTIVGTEKIVQTYTLTNVPIQKRLYEGDIVSVKLPNGEVQIIVSGTKSSLLLDTPNGNQYVQLGEEVKLDVDGLPGSDIVIFLSDVSKNDSARGAEVRMFTLEETETAQNAEVDITSVPLASQLNSEASAKQTVLFEGNRAYPFTINATFRGACLFRSMADKNEPTEDYFSSGDIQTINANNGVRVWMSNANALKMQVIGDGKTVDIEVGRPGQILVQDIKWIKDYDGKFKLVVLEVD